MVLYGIVINMTGFESKIKLVEEDVFDWVVLPNNPKAKIDVVPLSVFEKMENDRKAMKYFRGNTNDLIKPSDYENFKAEIAPAFKDNFESLEDAKNFVKEQGFVYGDTLVKYIQV